MATAATSVTGEDRARGDQMELAIEDADLVAT